MNRHLEMWSINWAWLPSRQPNATRQEPPMQVKFRLSEEEDKQKDFFWGGGEALFCFSFVLIFSNVVKIHAAYTFSSFLPAQVL